MGKSYSFKNAIVSGSDAASCTEVKPYFTASFIVVSKYIATCFLLHFGNGTRLIALSMNTPVGFPDASRLMIPPSTSGRSSGMSSRTRFDTHNACTSTRRSAIGLPARKGSRSKSSYEVRFQINVVCMTPECAYRGGKLRPGPFGLVPTKSFNPSRGVSLNVRMGANVRLQEIKDIYECGSVDRACLME